MPRIYPVSEKQLAAAFTKWESDYRADPEKFWDDQKRRATKPENYGEAGARVLIEYLTEQTPELGAAAPAARDAG